MLPTLSLYLGEQRLTNKSMRPSSIRAMKRAGMGDRQITDVTLHKKIATLQNYDLEITPRDRRAACGALGNIGAPANIVHSAPQSLQVILPLPFVCKYM